MSDCLGFTVYLYFCEALQIAAPPEATLIYCFADTILFLLEPLVLTNRKGEKLHARDFFVGFGEVKHQV